MTISDQEEQAERRRVLLQDADLRRQQQEQSGTFFSHAQAAANDTAGGRFASVSPTSIVGSEPAVKYPASSPSWQIQLPDEPPSLEDPTGALPVSRPVEQAAQTEAARKFAEQTEKLRQLADQVAEQNKKLTEPGK